jgi:hypothetical protein
LEKIFHLVSESDMNLPGKPEGGIKIVIIEGRYLIKFS